MLRQPAFWQRRPCIDTHIGLLAGPLDVRRPKVRRTPADLRRHHDATRRRCARLRGSTGACCPWLVLPGSFDLTYEAGKHFHGHVTSACVAIVASRRASARYPILRRRRLPHPVRAPYTTGTPHGGYSRPTPMMLLSDSSHTRTLIWPAFWWWAHVSAQGWRLTCSPWVAGAALPCL